MTALVGSKPELVYRHRAYLVAFGLEVVGNVIHAVGPFARRQPEFDEADARAQGHEARIVAFTTCRQASDACVVWEMISGCEAKFR